MTRVMAQGTFDLLHPGHLHYLRESRKLGDELHVVISRDSRLKTKNPVMDEESRREMVNALDMVDEAVLGSEEDIFDSVRRLRPDIITLGHDQGFEKDELKGRLEEEGLHGIDVRRIGKFEGEIESSSDIRRMLRDG